jgi:hypothetical protein
MTPARTMWKKGRGKLGVLDPLLGRWQARAESELGDVVCMRRFRAVWQFAEGSYEELALFGVGPDGTLSFWSFTSDGKQSQGRLVDVSDIHPEAVGFEAHMPAGLARQAYWPHPEGGVLWAVEAKTKVGWKRFTEHHYFPQ